MKFMKLKTTVNNMKFRGINQIKRLCYLLDDIFGHKLYMFEPFSIEYCRCGIAVNYFLAFNFLQENVRVQESGT